MPQEDPHGPREQEVRLRVGARLRDLAERLDPASFELLLKLMSGVNAAFDRRNEPIDIQMTPEERALYTPVLERELVALLELASVPPERIHTETVSERPRHASWPYVVP
ncbi:hypothetical protein [Streptomyces sp. NPDC048172]|uniref:hypothetical protein n=1 Tax=Streptomyces sp. NPDC048172 TaxID=3365505 RepID=UPI00371F4910